MVHERVELSLTARESLWNGVLIFLGLVSGTVPSPCCTFIAASMTPAGEHIVDLSLRMLTFPATPSAGSLSVRRSSRLWVSSYCEKVLQSEQSLVKR